MESMRHRVRPLWDKLVETNSILIQSLTSDRHDEFMHNRSKGIFRKKEWASGIRDL